MIPAGNSYGLWRTALLICVPLLTSKSKALNFYGRVQNSDKEEAHRSIVQDNVQNIQNLTIIEILYSIRVQRNANILTISKNILPY